MENMIITSFYIPLTPTQIQQLPEILVPYYIFNQINIRSIIPYSFISIFFCFETISRQSQIALTLQSFYLTLPSTGQQVSVTRFFRYRLIEAVSIQQTDICTIASWALVFLFLKWSRLKYPTVYNSDVKQNAEGGIIL